MAYKHDPNCAVGWGTAACSHHSARNISACTSECSIVLAFSQGLSYTMAMTGVKERTLEEGPWEIYRQRMVHELTEASLHAGQNC